MKQAQTDADELIAAYKGEQQDAFDKAASASGKSGEFLQQNCHNLFILLLLRTVLKKLVPPKPLHYMYAN